MESVQILLVLIIFLTLAVLMFFRKIPALLALPLMAFLIPLVSGVAPLHIIEFVLGKGATKLTEAYTIAIFGSMLSILLQKTGVAERFIKIGAELSGDKPWTISVIMLIMIILLFTTLGGLGAIIMVATVVLPILTSVGVGGVTTVGIFLFGLSIGGIFNVGNWAVYKELGLEVDQVRTFALIMFAISIIIALVYITISLYRDGNDINLRGILFKTVITAILIAAAYFGFNALPDQMKDMIANVTVFAVTALKFLIGGGIILVMVTAMIRSFHPMYKNKFFWGAYFTPLVPLLLILLFNINFIASFIVGLLFGFITTRKENSLNTFIRSVLEGGAVVMPAVVLMLGIGMLLNAVMGPGGDIVKALYPSGWPVLTLLKPVMMAVIPESRWAFILIFSVAAPLALYRGPLNVWGMGYGLAAILLASGLNAGAIMGILMAVGQIQGISDPTNTQNVWLANEMRVDVQKILWNTIPYTWLAALFGIIAAAFLYF